MNDPSGSGKELEKSKQVKPIKFSVNGIAIHQQEKVMNGENLSIHDSGHRITESPSAIVVQARCTRGRHHFGMRVEKIPSGTQGWMVKNTFAIQDSVAGDTRYSTNKNEGYDKTSITGTINIDPTYPGCPYCGAKGFWKCGICDRVNCWDGKIRHVTCAWCGESGELSGEINSLEGSPSSNSVKLPSSPKSIETTPQLHEVNVYRPALRKGS